VVVAFDSGKKLANEESKTPMFVIDGKPATAEQMQNLPTERIKMMAVLKEESTTEYWSEFGDTSNGVVVVHTHSLDPRVESDPDTLPTFLGGDIDNFSQWVAAYVHYPYGLEDKSLWAHMVVKYIVNDTGYVEVVEINTIKGTPHRLFDEEVRRVMVSCPQWQPATKNGKAVAYQGIVPVLFGSF
ncbi:MAG: energy transducer TonB, partial [Alistipes sp.]|nr:energy transducer TonB [Alistipes sp.]